MDSCFECLGKKESEEAAGDDSNALQLVHAHHMGVASCDLLIGCIPGYWPCQCP
jgi:hypothetical protein